MSPFFKIIDEYPGYAIGQIVEFNSPSRIAAMNGDGVNPQRGVQVLPPKPQVKKVVEPVVVKKEVKTLSKKKGVVKNANNTNRGLDGNASRNGSKSIGSHGNATAIKKGSKKTGAKKVVKKSR